MNFLVIFIEVVGQFGVKITIVVSHSTNTRLKGTQKCFSTFL